MLRSLPTSLTPRRSIRLILVEKQVEVARHTPHTTSDKMIILFYYPMAMRCYEISHMYVIIRWTHEAKKTNLVC